MSIEELERLRKKAKNIILFGIAITFITGILLLIITHFPLIILFTIVIGIMIFGIASTRLIHKFNSAFKETFVLKSLQSVFTNLVYEPYKELDQSIIKKTGMMYMGNRYSSNDFISGTYKNVNVIQADVHIEEEYETTDSNGNKSTDCDTLFKGRWMIFDFHKPFKANIQVRQKGFTNSKLYNYDSKLKYKKIIMEDQEFNNQFKVYAQDEHEAFYILTPSLMEKIKNIANHISGNLLFCFVDNQLHVGIHNNKDSFEHGIFNKIDEEKITNNILKDIKMITNFIDDLDLDNDLFRKDI